MLSMMSTDEINSPPDEAAPIASNAELYRRFREAMDLFTQGMLSKARAMMKTLSEEKPGSAEVRDASAIVIATQRIMEMQDSYEQKVQTDGAGDGAGDARRLADQFNAIARDVGLIRPTETVAGRAQSNARRSEEEIR
jgi:hypothetical protein